MDYSRDPLGEAAGINLFAYVNGIPTSGVDPEGLQVQQLLRRLIPFVRNQGPKIFERCKIGIDDLLRQFNRPNKGTPPLRFGDTQLGKKLGKHVRDFGGNPSNPVDRAKVKSIIDDIGNNPDKIINGTFSGQGPAGGRGPVQFRIKGNDVVVTKPDGEFVTILKDGLNNTSVKKALGQL